MDPVRLPRRRSAAGDPDLGALGTWAAALVAALGPEVLREVGRFARGAGPGSMITIRCTRDGFTAQVTGAIVGGRVAPVTADSISAIVLDIDENARASKHLSEAIRRTVNGMNDVEWTVNTEGWDTNRG